MKNVKHKLIDCPGEIDKSIITVENFNIFQNNLQIQQTKYYYGCSEFEQHNW